MSSVTHVTIEAQPATAVTVGHDVTKVVGGIGIGPPGLSGRATIAFDQTVAATVWTIPHGTQTYPAVTVVNGAGDEIEGEVSYPDNNTVVITFSVALTGRALLN